MQKSGTISIVRSLALSLFACVAVAGVAKVASSMDVDNRDLAELYVRHLDAGALKDGRSEDLCARASSMCRANSVQTANDMYRAASILIRSNDLGNVLLAHDLGLAALIQGFRPGLWIVSEAESKLMARAKIERFSEPTFSTPSSDFNRGGGA